MRVIIPVLVLALTVSPAFAKPEHAEGKGKGRPHKEKIYEQEVREHDKNDHELTDVTEGVVRALLGLSAPEKERLSTRFATHYRKHCPPGLAKKHNGCLPPGQAKHYAVGQVLPDDFIYWDVPSDVLTLLPAAPRGSRYIAVDKDVLLINEGTKKILDAITLFSAVD